MVAAVGVINAECLVRARAKFRSPTFPKAALRLARRSSGLLIADLCAAGNPLDAASYRFLILGDCAEPLVTAQEVRPGEGGEDLIASSAERIGISSHPMRLLTDR